MTVRFELRCDRSAPAHARRLLREVVAANPRAGELTPRLGDVELILSELVSNAVVHGQCEQTELTIMIDDDHLRVEVSDPGRGGPVERRTADLTGSGGLGLHLVDRLADRWGHHDDRDDHTGSARRRVWFDVRVGGSPVGAPTTAPASEPARAGQTDTLTS
ncbi:MAG: ATP-binding protein [Acidimicrobiales bacterium]